MLLFKIRKLTLFNSHVNIAVQNPEYGMIYYIQGLKDTSYVCGRHRQRPNMQIKDIVTT